MAVWATQIRSPASGDPLSLVSMMTLPAVWRGREGPGNRHLPLAKTRWPQLSGVERLGVV